MGENGKALRDEIVFVQFAHGENAPRASNIVQVHGLLEIGNVVALELLIQGLEGGGVEEFTEACLAFPTLIDDSVELLGWESGCFGEVTAFEESDLGKAAEFLKHRVVPRFFREVEEEAETSPREDCEGKSQSID